MNERMVLLAISLAFILLLAEASEAFLIEESHESLDLYVGTDDSV